MTETILTLLATAGVIMGSLGIVAAGMWWEERETRRGWEHLARLSAGKCDCGKGYVPPF